MMIKLFSRVSPKRIILCLNTSCCMHVDVNMYLHILDIVPKTIGGFGENKRELMGSKITPNKSRRRSLDRQNWQN